MCDGHNCKHKVLFIIGHQKNHILHLPLKITLAKITVRFDCGSGTSWRHLLPKLPRQTGPYHGINIPGDVVATMNGSKEGFGAMAGVLQRVEPTLLRTVAEAVV